MRREAVRAIAIRWRDHPDTRPWLHDRATNDQHWQPRSTAVEAIANGWPDHPDTRPWLHDRATNDPNEYVRQAAESLAATWPSDSVGRLS